MTNTPYRYCYLLFVLFLKVYGNNLEAGDTCNLKSGNSGLCKYLSECTPALALLSDGGFPEDICSSVGSQYIVCCEDTTPVTKPPVTPKPPPPEIPTPQIVTDYVSTNRKVGEISVKKCKEYEKYVWDSSTAPTLSIVTHISNTFECPFDKLTLIVGGTAASRQEFPHMALIGYSKGQETEWSCGGSLISLNYVLTASHCLKHRQLGLANLVRIGMANRTDTTNMQELTISEVRYHPEYNSKSKYHDIALLKLSKEVDPNNFVRPACLHTKTDISYTKAIASGWGNVGFTGHSSQDLLKVVLEFFDNESCNKTYRRQINKKETDINRGIDEELMICAGSKKELKDTCQGDSGGPLQIYYDGAEDIKCMYDIVGVTSFGKACGLAKNSPGVYTRVSRYVKWIEDIVWPE